MKFSTQSIPKKPWQLSTMINLKEQFPIFKANPELVYLDSAATTQKPQVVIDAISSFYQEDNANIHRGVYKLSQESTRLYEEARKKVANFINAKSEKEIIFVRSATEAINLVAQTYGKQNISKGAEILISEMEHHANIVPWQMLCEEKGAILKIIPMDDNGELILSDLEQLLSAKTKLVAVVHISNTLGTINPVKEIIKLAHQKNIPVLIDGCQAIQHLSIDIQDLDADFYVFSGHKLYGPTGIGVLYGKQELLDQMPPYQVGGDMIESVTFEKTTFQKAPAKFEAGTPNIAGAIGLGYAIDFVIKIGLKTIAAHEKELMEYAISQLTKIKGLKIIGLAKEKAPIISFTLAGIHPHDLGTILDEEGIAIRTGHHCTQPIMKHFAIAATSRASFAIYNQKEDIDRLIEGIKKAKKILLK